MSKNSTLTPAVARFRLRQDLRSADAALMNAFRKNRQEWDNLHKQNPVQADARHLIQSYPLIIAREIIKYNGFPPPNAIAKRSNEFRAARPGLEALFRRVNSVVGKLVRDPAIKVLAKKAGLSLGRRDMVALLRHDFAIHIINLSYDPALYSRVVPSNGLKPDKRQPTAEKVVGDIITGLWRDKAGVLGQFFRPDRGELSRLRL